MWEYLGSIDNRHNVVKFTLSSGLDVELDYYELEELKTLISKDSLEEIEDLKREYGYLEDKKIEISCELDETLELNRKLVDENIDLKDKIEKLLKRNEGAI